MPLQTGVGVWNDAHLTEFDISCLNPGLGDSGVGKVIYFWNDSEHFVQFLKSGSVTNNGFSPNKYFNQTTEYITSKQLLFSISLEITLVLRHAIYEHTKQGWYISQGECELTD